MHTPDDPPVSNIPPDHHDQLIDVRSLSCPLPLLRTKKTLATMPPASILKVTARADVRDDLIAFTRQTGHQLLCQQEETLPDGIVLLHNWIRRKHQ